MFPAGLIRFINKMPKGEPGDDSCYPEGQEVFERKDPASNIRAVPKYRRPESQKEQKKKQNMNWKKVFFHVIIIERVSSFRNYLFFLMQKITKKTALIGLLILTALVGVWRFVIQPWQQKDEQNSLTPPMSDPTTKVTPVSSGEEAVNLKKASVRTSYKNPGGEDEVGYSIVVDESGTIVTASAEVLAKNPTSIKRQEAFAEGLLQAIQGKKISDLTAIDKVGGSSLTTASFNASLAELKAGL